MTTGIPFRKGHGTGNDFIVIDDHYDQVDLTPRLVAALCHRRMGIGADGVLRVVRDGASWFMDYRNSDGTVAGCAATARGCSPGIWSMVARGLDYNPDQGRPPDGPNRTSGDVTIGMGR